MKNLTHNLKRIIYNNNKKQSIINFTKMCKISTKIHVNYNREKM